MNQDQPPTEDRCGRFWNGMDLLKDATENKCVLPTGLERYFYLEHSHALSIQSSSLIGYVNILLIYMTCCDQYDPGIIYVIFQLLASTHFLEVACAKVS